MNYKKLIKKKSPAHGLGCFAGESIKKGELIAHWFDQAKLVDAAELKRTAADPIVFQTTVKLIGSAYIGAEKAKLNSTDFINHSDAPNILYFVGVLIANRDIKKGEELFIDYRLLNHPEIKDVVYGAKNSLEMQINQMKKLFGW